MLFQLHLNYLEKANITNESVLSATPRQIYMRFVTSPHMLDFMKLVYLWLFCSLAKQT